VTARALVRSAATLLTSASLTSIVGAAPILRSADVRITILSPASCDVTIDLTLTGAGDVDHRIETFDGSRIELVEVRGAQQIGEPRTIGRTQSLRLRPAGAYGFSYRALQPADRVNRCPIWLPTIPTDGHPGGVRLSMDIPVASSASSTMPAFAWTGTHGSATLAHLPSHVAVSIVPSGSRVWDISRVMDVLAMSLFVGATAAWVWWTRR
jgi:hypothetical protein